jgi:hypothetical protein
MSVELPQDMSMFALMLSDCGTEPCAAPVMVKNVYLCLPGTHFEALSASETVRIR